MLLFLLFLFSDLNKQKTKKIKNIRKRTKIIILLSFLFVYFVSLFCLFILFVYFVCLFCLLFSKKRKKLLILCFYVLLLVYIFFYLSKKNLDLNKNKKIKRVDPPPQYFINQNIYYSIKDKDYQPTAVANRNNYQLVLGSSVIKLLPITPSASENSVTNKRSSVSALFSDHLLQTYLL